MISQPRIAILHYAAPPTIGGVESTIAAHARLFASHGYPVKIIAGRGEPFDSRIPVTIIRDVDSKSELVLQVNAELVQGIVSKKFQTLVNRLIDTLTNALADCDVLIAHNVLSLHKNLALTTALESIPRLKLIAWCHDFAWTDPQYADEIHPGLPWALLKQPWREVAYIVVSEARKRELENLWHASANISIIPPGIDACEFLGVTEKTRQWISDLGLAGAEPLLLLPARLTRRKKIERAIETISALRRCGANAKLIVTGPPGPHNPANVAYLEQLQAQRRVLGVQDAVLFLYELGTVDAATQRDLFLLADALFFPSEREGFGIPILEAGLARLPIFCSDLPPFRESAGDYAHYFSPDALADEIAQQIIDMLSRNPAYQLKRRVMQEYAWERIFTQQIVPLVQGD